MNKKYSTFFCTRFDKFSLSDLPEGASNEAPQVALGLGRRAGCFRFREPSFV